MPHNGISNCYSYLCFLLQTVYFQTNIATDGNATHVSFVYEDGGMLWENLEKNPVQGYAISMTERRAIYKRILSNSGNQTAYRFDAVVGNTGFKGRWSWRLGEQFDNNSEYISINTKELIDACIYTDTHVHAEIHTSLLNETGHCGGGQQYC